MTIGEIERFTQSAVRVKEKEAKEKAVFDYIQAQLIAKGLAKVFSSENTFPKIEEAYPSLFKDKIAEENTIQNNQDNLSASRFLQFAQNFNSRYEEAANRSEK